jgi:hypothetical protein
MFDGTDVPDERDNFEFLHQADVGRLIRKSTKPRLTNSDIDPRFIGIEFSEERDGLYLEKHFVCGADTPPKIKERLLALIKKYWCCFCEENVKLHIQGYECVIDTGDSKPTVARNSRYGIHETPIMQRAIESLLLNDQIELDNDSSWLSRIVLAPKPHTKTSSEVYFKYL